MIGRVGSVNARVMALMVNGVRHDEIYVLIFLFALLCGLDLLEDSRGHVHLVLLFLIDSEAEVASLAVDGLLEDERFAWVGGDHAVDERNKSLADHLGVRVRETVEDESLGVNIDKDVGEVRLELAVSAAAKAEKLDAGGAAELCRICHSGAAGA